MKEIKGVVLKLYRLELINRGSLRKSYNIECLFNHSFDGGGD